MNKFIPALFGLLFLFMNDSLLYGQSNNLDSTVSQILKAIKNDDSSIMVKLIPSRREISAYWKEQDLSKRLKKQLIPTRRQDKDGINMMLNDFKNVVAKARLSGIDFDKITSLSILTSDSLHLAIDEISNLPPNSVVGRDNKEVRIFFKFNSTQFELKTILWDLNKKWLWNSNIKLISELDPKSNIVVQPR